MVLHDGSGAALHGQDASDLQDDVLGRGPTRQGPGQLHSNHLTDGEVQGEKPLSEATVAPRRPLV